MIKIKEEILDYYYSQKEETSIDKIRKFEEKNNITFPKEYKDFLLKFNGAELNYPVFDLEIEDEIYEVCIWSVLGLKETNGLVWANAEYGEEMPNEFIIICHGDGFIIMNWKTEEIYFWDDEYTLLVSNQKHNVYKVADSFKEFIEKLYMEE